MPALYACLTSDKRHRTAPNLHSMKETSLIILSFVKVQQAEKQLSPLDDLNIRSHTRASPNSTFDQNTSDLSNFRTSLCFFLFGIPDINGINFLRQEKTADWASSGASEQSLGTVSPVKPVNNQLKC